MKIDKVLEAHGIGIVQLNPPITTPKIVTDGLVGYWNSKRGINGEIWSNISPNTTGQYDAIIDGATVTNDGLYFDGANDFVQIPIPTAMKGITSGTFEMRFKTNGGWADIINQSGRELMWVGPVSLELAGIFDTIKNRDHKAIRRSMEGVTLLLTVTADLSNNRITAYLYNVADETVVSDFYVTTIGTFADGDFVWLSGTNTRFNGILDNIRLYNRVLTQEEMIQNWSVGVNLGV